MTEPSYPLYTFRKMSLVLGGKMCGFQGNFRGQRHALEKRQSAGSGRGAATGAGKGSFILAFKRNDACSTQDYSHSIYCSQDELGARIPLRSPSVPRLSAPPRVSWWAWWRTCRPTRLGIFVPYAAASTLQRLFFFFFSVGMCPFLRHREKNLRKSILDLQIKLV